MKKEEVPEEVLRVLRSLSDQGVLQEALSQLAATTTGGSSMSDAAKRCGDELSENDEFQLVRHSPPRTSGSDVNTQHRRHPRCGIAPWCVGSGDLGPHVVHIAQSREAWFEL